jgi:TonB family protein
MLARMRALPLALLLAAAPLTSLAAPPEGPAGASGATGATEELPVAEVEKFFKSHTAEVLPCYTDALKKKPGLAGTVVVAFTIRPDGALEGVKVAESTVADPAVGACVAGKMAAWKTPFKPSQPRTGKFPFQFSPAKP